MKLTLLATLLLGATPMYVGEVDTFTIKPSETDPKITQFDSPHNIYVDKSAKAKDLLLLYLPGTHGKASGSSEFCKVAAKEGYQVIDLMYPDNIPADTVSNSTDRNLFLHFRLEIIEGKDLCPQVAVDRTNCIENRLIKLLQYLEKKKPEEHWGRYLTSHGDIEWSRIAVSGLSQGAGHAALLATLHECARAVLFGGPKDFDKSANLPAAWYTTTPKTPLKLIFAFFNAQDHQGCSPAEQFQNWKAMGLYRFAEPWAVDGIGPPYHNSHMLVTNWPGHKIPSDKAHTSVVADSTTPTGPDGTPLFKPVWVYMLTHDSEPVKSEPAPHGGGHPRKKAGSKTKGGGGH